MRVRDLSGLCHPDVIAALGERVFVLDRLRRCLRLVARRGDDDALEGEIDAEYVDDGGGAIGVVTLRLHGIRKLVLPEFTPGYWFTELELDDVSGDQLEGLRYRLATRGGDSSFEAWCWGVSVEAFVRCASLTAAVAVT